MRNHLLAAPDTAMLNLAATPTLLIQIVALPPLSAYDVLTTALAEGDAA